MRPDPVTTRQVLARWFGAWFLVAFVFVALFGVATSMPADVWLPAFLMTAFMLGLHATVAAAVLLILRRRAIMQPRSFEFVTGRMAVGVIATVPGSLLLSFGIVKVTVLTPWLTLLLALVAGALGGAMAVPTRLVTEQARNLPPTE